VSVEKLVADDTAVLMLCSGTQTLSYFDPTCGVPVDQYLWLNELHPTYPVHNLMASQIVQQFTG